MNEEFKMGPSSPVRRGELQVVSDEKVPSRLRHGNPIRKTSETTELLFITLAEQRLWKQLLGILSPSLWEVKVSAALQSDSPVISFTGSPEVVPRAKETISKLLILVGSQVQVNRIDVPHLKAAGFFQLQKGSHLFLWEGEASHIRADAVVRIGTNGGLDSGNAVFAQRVWSPERSLYTNLDIHFSCPPTAGLAAVMVKLALEAASRKGFQSVVVTYSGSTISTTEAEVIVLGMEAFRKKHPVGPLKSLHVVSEDRHATMLFYKECQKHWSSGKDDSEKLRNMLLSLESTKIEVATSPEEKKKADVVVLPLVLDPDGLDWGSGVHAITQKALEIVPQCSDLCPGDILLVAGSAFPELGCRMIYLVRFDDLQQTSKEAHKIEDSVCFAAEPVGLCHMEEPLFLQYLEENSSAFNEFQVQLKKAGYDIQIDFDWRLLIFQAINQSMQLLDLEKAFEFVRKKYVLHCETRGEILKVLIDHQRLMKRYKSLRIYILDRMWLVGLLDEVCCFLQCLAQEASQRQLVSWECTAEPLPWYTIAKDVVLQEILPSNPMIKLEIIAKTPATIRFWGPHRRVKEAERRLKELLNTFQILPIPLSNFQLQFVKAHWGKVFYNHFFLERSIPVVLELSQVVQIAGLDLGKMKEAKEILMKLVCERTVDIAEDLKWATECSEWKELLQRLGTHKEVAIHHVAPGWVILVGFYPLVFQAEDSIKEYLRENSPMEEKVRLTGPELALAGKDLLHIMGWERLGMNVAFQVNSQPLVLLVSGLQKYVKKALPAIKKDLDSLAFDIVPLRKRILSEYFSGVGASLLKNMAWPLGCIAGMKTENRDAWNSFINNEDLIKERFATGFSEAIYVMGKRDPVILLKQNVAGFITKFSTKSIRHEAIATSKNMNIDEFLRSIFHNFPVDIRWSQDDELQICGFQDDVENVLEAVHRKIEKYLSEIIEVKAQYESVPYIVIKKSLFQKRFPTSPFVSTEMLAKDPATIIFRGPRQKLVELRKHFEELFSGFQFLPVSLSELQFQFVKTQWGKLFHDGFFSERNILAILEISEVVQIGGLSLGELQEAKKLLMEQVCEKTVEIADQLQWVTEETEWEELLNRLKSHKKVAVHYTPPNQVTVVGPSPQAAEVEEYIKEHLRDNSPLKESMMLTRSELVLAGGESLLHIMDWEHLKVNIKFKPSNCRLSLQVKGLRKFVKEAIPVIKKDLDSLMFGLIPLKKKTLCIYFSEDGADLLKNMAETQNCIVKMQTQGSHNSSNGTTRSNGEVLQDLTEDHRAVIHVVGIRNEVTSLKQHLSDFIAKFHKKTICSAELSTFSNDSLKALCEAVSPQYPVVFHRLTEKVVWLCGSQEDVENVSGKIYTKLEEVLVAKIEKAQAEHTDSKLLYETIRWHHRSDAGWSTFDMLTNRYLEQAYSEKKTEALVPWDGQKLAINFLTGEAFMPSKKKIRIRREICLWDKNIAPYWEAMDGLVKKVELQAHSKEYQDVVKNFNKTAGNYNVVKVERIQNRYLWVSYCWKKSWMEKRNPEGTKNELILYHGTLSENCSSVCEIGFKNAFRKQSLYGQGIYFSVAAGRAVYYAKPDPRGLRYVFQARVLTGEYGCGKENMVLPPVKQEGNGRYDSLVDVLSKPNIFVVFFDDHAYPEYLITFRGMTSS